MYYQLQREKLLNSLVEIQSQNYDRSVLISLQDTQTKGRRRMKKKDKSLPLEASKKRPCEEDIEQQSKKQKIDHVSHEIEVFFHYLFLKKKIYAVLFRWLLTSRKN